MGRDDDMGRLHKLNSIKVNTLREPGLYSDGGCLHLRVAPGGSKQWVFRYSLGHRTRDYGVGPFPTLSLADARDRAHALRKLLLDKIDPIEQRRRERAVAQVGEAKHITFDAAAKTYIAEHERSWRSVRTHSEWVNTLTAYASPVFGKLPVSAIDTSLIVRALKPLWIERQTVGQRLRGRIESILDWATAMGYRVGDNPARLNGHLAHLLPQQTHRVEHHSAMPYSDVPGLMREPSTLTAVAAPALQFVILTAARAGEVVGMTWDEVDLDKREWTVPANRMKAHRPIKSPCPTPQWRCWSGRRPFVTPPSFSPGVLDGFRLARSSMSSSRAG
jgi:integrase